MVNVEIVITDSSGNAIEGIPVNIKVIPQNFFSGIKTYYLKGITNAYGQYIISNAQAYANFIVTANQPNSTQYQSEWSSAQGSTSTTLFSGGFVNLTLQSVSSSSCGSVLGGWSL